LFSHLVTAQMEPCSEASSERSGTAEVKEAQAKTTPDSRALAAAPHLVSTAPVVEYQLVIPTYQRWRPACELTRKRVHSSCKEPFILKYTLAFLAKEDVPVDRVTLFVADEAEKQRYSTALADSAWSNVKIVVSASGIRNSRNFICTYYPESTYVVSIDDDFEGLRWKCLEERSNNSAQPLPPGNFLKIVYDARQRMAEKGAFLWGLNTSQNHGCMDMRTVTMRCGLINGYCHGFISRPKCTDLLRILQDAVEDCENSVRYFAKDGVVLRYRMYRGVTDCFGNQGGLQAKFEAGGERSVCSGRKSEETLGAQALHELFPKLVKAPQQKQESSTTKARSELAMSVKFRSVMSRREQKLRKRKAADKVARRIRKLCGSQCASKKLKPIKIAFKKGRRKRRHKPGQTNNVMTVTLRDEDVVNYKPNVKKHGSSAYKRYELYMHSKTAGEARKLGSMPLDFSWDVSLELLTITQLDTKPESTECQVRDHFSSHDDAVAVGTVTSKSAASHLKVRICEIREAGHVGLQLPRTIVAALASRCPRWKDIPTKRWAARDGPLANVRLRIVRILLHWAEHGVLLFRSRQAEALQEVLTAAGAEELATQVERKDVNHGQVSLLKFWQSSSAPSVAPAVRVKQEPGKVKQEPVKVKQEPVKVKQELSKDKDCTRSRSVSLMSIWSKAGENGSIQSTAKNLVDIAAIGSHENDTPEKVVMPEVKRNTSGSHENDTLEKIVMPEVEKNVSGHTSDSTARSSGEKQTQIMAFFSTKAAAPSKRESSGADEKAGPARKRIRWAKDVLHPRSSTVNEDGSICKAGG